MRIRGGINVLPRIRVYPAEAAAREEARPRFTVDLAGHRVLDADGTVLAGAWTLRRKAEKTRSKSIRDSDGRGPRSVFCWNPSDWARLTPASKTTIAFGYVEFRSPRQINLAPNVCAVLDRIHYRHHPDRAAAADHNTC